MLVRVRTKTPWPLGAVVDQRLQGVVAEVRAGGDRVGAEAGGRAGEAGGAAERGAPVGRAGRGDVAALDVEDHRQLVLVGAPDDRAEGAPAGGAVLLEERRLRLDAGGDVGDGVDDAAAELLEAGGDGGVVAELRRLRPVLLDELRRHALEHGVEADADDAASRADGGGQSVGEVLHGDAPYGRARPSYRTEPGRTPRARSGVARQAPARELPDGRPAAGRRPARPRRRPAAGPGTGARCGGSWRSWRARSRWPRRRSRPARARPRTPPASRAAPP